LETKQEDLGEIVKTVKSNKFILTVKSIFWIAFSVVFAYFYTTNRDSFGDFSQSQWYVQYLPYLASIVSFGYGFFAFLELIRNKIEIFENGLLIRKAIGKKKILNSEIGHFDWTVSSYKTGFLALYKRTTLVICGKDKFPITSINTGSYSKLKNTMLELEEKLGI